MNPADVFFLVVSALYGATIGSFLNVCIFRMPRACLRIWKPKLSFCPKCRRTLPWHDNLPIVGYLMLLGKCRGCRAPIPFRYFLVEVGTAALFAWIATRHLLSTAPERDFGLAFVHMAFGAALIVCALVDWDHRIIPDEIDVPGFLVAPLVCFFVPALVNEAWGAPSPSGIAREARVLLASALPWWGLSTGATGTCVAPLAWVESFALSPHEAGLRAAFASLAGVALGGGSIWIIGWVGDRAFRSSEGAMGFGDVKFMAMVGGFVGWHGVVVSIVAASIMGSIWGMYSKIATGRPVATGKDLAECSPLSYRALRLAGAPEEAPDEQVLELGFGGRLAARFATGDPYLPFGPFLALGAGLYAFAPEVLAGVYHAYVRVFVP